MLILSWHIHKWGLSEIHFFFYYYYYYYRLVSQSIKNDKRASCRVLRNIALLIILVECTSDLWRPEWCAFYCIMVIALVTVNLHKSIDVNPCHAKNNLTCHFSEGKSYKESCITLLSWTYLFVIGYFLIILTILVIKLFYSIFRFWLNCFSPNKKVWQNSILSIDRILLLF